jgi:hypothetical protein
MQYSDLPVKDLVVHSGLGPYEPAIALFSGVPAADVAVLAAADVVVSAKNRADAAVNAMVAARTASERAEEEVQEADTAYRDARQALLEAVLARGVRLPSAEGR